MHVRQSRFQLAQHVGVEREVDVRILAVDAVDLGEARERVLRDRVPNEVVGADRVRVLLLLRLRERAELALHAADVRLVQVEVLDEVDLVAAAAHTAREIGELAEGEQVVRLHEREPVLEVEPLARLDLLAYRCEHIEGVENRHAYLSLSTTACVSDSSSSRCSSPLRHARALLAYSSATSRERSSAPVAATRTSTPWRGPPASARRTTSSSRAASRSGSVGVPSRRSVPAILPVSIVSPVQSRMSSAIWNAIPSARPNWASSRVDPSPAPSTQAASKSLPVFRSEEHTSELQSRVDLV